MALRRKTPQDKDIQQLQIKELQEIVTNLTKEIQELKEQQKSEGNLGEVVNTLIQEIKGLQDFTFSLQKTLKEHAENSQYLLSKINKTEGIADKNAGDIYNLKIKEGLHSDLLDRAKPIIDIADPLSKVAFRIQKLETSLQKVTKDFNPQELKERQEVNTNCIADLQTDFLLHGQMLADLRLEIEKVKQLQTLHDKQIRALIHEVSKSVWEKLFK
ncbi:MULTISPECIES: hypothetical protein [Helicobacter]|uniref:Uncharacterized protein n=1 Tax=Helicobacter bilis ATCC 43879 TaxID=613026 RepID=C3XIJ6_9HELI|nr:MULTISPECIES: hypothetical protein [Helicobacter]EEO24814.1 hypothetical protein HRAG_01871 [Helicobacter bilis ATCC 43879]